MKGKADVEAATTERSRAATPRRREWRRADAVICVCVFFIALVVYLRTMRPTFGWGDSSELITAAYHLGIGHSPGYPTWMLLAYPFAHLPMGDVAFRVNFMTALLGAVAVGLLYVVYRMVSGSRFGGFLGALCFGFTVTFWDVTTEAEVYTLHICLAALMLLIVLRWRATRGDRLLYVLAWLIGVSLGNHALTALMVPAIIYLVWSEEGWRFFTRRRVLVAAGLFVVGISVYAYLPIRAMSDPPPHLNNPRTLAGLWTQLTSPGARTAMFDEGIVVALLRVKYYLFERPILEFGHAGFALSGLGLGLLVWRDRRLAIALLVIGLLDVAYAVNFSIFDIYIYYLPLYMMLAAFVAVGAAGIVGAVAEVLRRLPRGGASLTPAVRYGPAAALLLVVPFMQVTSHFAYVDGSEDYGSERFARAVFEQVEPGSMILADWWTIAPLGYLKHIEGERQDVMLFAGPSIQDDEEFAELVQEEFLRRYPAVYFAEMLTYRAEFMEEKWWLVPEGPVSRVVMDRPDPGTLLADIPATPVARFGEKVGLVRAEVEREKLRPGEPLGVTLYWTPLPGHEGERLETILVLEKEGGAGEEEGAAANRIWQEMGILGHDLYPLAEWEQGEVLEEKHTVYLSGEASRGEYELFVRVREEGQGACLECDRSLPEHSARDYLVARIEVEEAEKPSERGRMPALVALLRR